MHIRTLKRTSAIIYSCIQRIQNLLLPLGSNLLLYFSFNSSAASGCQALCPSQSQTLFPLHALFPVPEPPPAKAPNEPPASGPFDAAFGVAPGPSGGKDLLGPCPLPPALPGTGPNVGRYDVVGIAWIVRNLFGMGRSSVLYCGGICRSTQYDKYRTYLEL